jgi:DNA-binding transcriptional LysR family regulator
MAELDLNLLKVIEALEEERSVSRAAAKLDKSQPAVSAALGKLRKYFDDPLFLRAGNLMQPTPRAAAIVSAARSIMGIVDTEIVSTPVFDAAASDRAIRLALSDVGEVVFLPTLLRRVRELMPRAAVCSVSLPASEVIHDLEKGGVDLAVGYFPDLGKSSFFQQTLFTDSFACLIRADHPITAGKLTIKQFVELEHAVVRVESRTEEVMERYLARKKIQRRIVLTTPHFASMPIIVAQSDLLVTVPEPLARYFAHASTNLRVVGLPFEPPRIELKQFWHRKFHRDPRNRWLRALIYKMFQTQREGSTAPRAQAGTKLTPAGTGSA